MLDPYPSSCIIPVPVSQNNVYQILQLSSCIQPYVCQLLSHLQNASSWAPASVSYPPVSNLRYSSSCIQIPVSQLLFHLRYACSRIPASVSFTLMPVTFICIPATVLTFYFTFGVVIPDSQLCILSLRSSSRILGPQSTPNSCITHYMFPNLCIYEFTYISSFSLLSVSHALVQYPSIYPGQVSSSLYWTFAFVWVGGIPILFSLVYKVSGESPLAW